MLKSLITWIYGLGGTNVVLAEILTTDSRFDICQSGKTIVSIPWTAITGITAFKRDLITVDILCLEIEVTHGGRSEVYEVNEEMKGFENLISQLDKRFSLKDNWREFVLRPPFKEQKIMLWGKPDPTPREETPPNFSRKF